METTVKGAVNFHAYTFTHVRAAPMTGAAMILVNLDRTLQASVPLPRTLAKKCTSVAEYHLTASGTAAAGGDAVLNAPRVALNGVELSMTAEGSTLPELTAHAGACGKAVVVGPLSAVVVLVQ